MFIAVFAPLSGWSPGTEDVESHLIEAHSTEKLKNVFPIFSVKSSRSKVKAHHYSTCEFACSANKNSVVLMYIELENEGVIIHPVLYITRLDCKPLHKDVYTL